jgi:toxin YoeB
MRDIQITPKAFGQLRYWADENAKILDRVFELLEDTARSPFKGIGKPEPLKGTNGYWSRRITSEHRLVYKVTPDTIIVIARRYHYDD